MDPEQLINGLEKIKVCINDIKIRIQEVESNVDEVLKVVKAKQSCSDALSRAAALQLNNYLDIDYCEVIDDVNFCNVYTDGALYHSLGGEAIAAGGIFFGKKSAMNLSLSFGFNLSNILEAELYTIYVCMHQIIKCKETNSEFSHTCFQILADNAAAINLANNINSKKFLSKDYYLNKADPSKIIHTLLGQMRKLLENSFNIKFTFKWIPAHTAGTDNNTIGNKFADQFAANGLKLTFDSQAISSQLLINNSIIYVSHPNSTQ